MSGSTLLRMSATVRTVLAARAAREGMSATALLERLIVEGVDQLEHPGVVFRGPATERRAAIAGGPDVREVVARLQELEGSEAHRITALSAETELHPRLLRIALDDAADHPDEVRERIRRNREDGRKSRGAEPPRT